MLTKNFLLITLCFVFNCFGSHNEQEEKEEDSVFEKFPISSLIRQKCLLDNSHHCAKLKTFWTCASTQPSENKYNESLEKIRANKGTEQDYKTVATFSHCEEHDNDWKSDVTSTGPYWHLLYHVNGALEKEYDCEAIIQEKGRMLAKFLTARKACLDAENRN
jgi:hypothetical protein